MNDDDTRFVDEDEFEDDLNDDDDLDGGVVPDDYDDLDDEDEDGEDDFDDEDYEDATIDDVDFVTAVYREEGSPVVLPLDWQLANDLDELIGHLRRLPGDAGALGMVSIDGEFFVLCRVRGRNVQVVLSDSEAAHDWPLARDVLDYLGLDLPEEDDSEPVGDFAMLADQGVNEFDLEQLAADLDEDSDQLVRRLAGAMGIGQVFERAIR